MRHIHLSLLFASMVSSSVVASVELDTAKRFNLAPNKAPSQNFDLSNWKLTLPELASKQSAKALEITKQQLSDPQQLFVHPQWFYSDKNTGALVFVAPNEAPTTPNSKNTRSELRAMLADKYDEPKNNFVVASHPNANEYGAIGGQLKATLSVDKVSSSGNDKKNGAFAVVIGQIHGSDNEPLKIVYRKLPEHENGSLAWSYELNPEPNLQDAVDSNGKKLRQDIRHNVFGKYNLRQGASDPKDGIKLGEIFAYEVNVEGDTMKLTFTKNPDSDKPIVKTFEVNLAQGNYQGNKVDLGYKNDWMYYKAGVYNQCNTNKSSSDCQWRGMEAGDYAQASFYQLELKQ
ncbi:polysaccharide lyase family 7 protein [Shewanella litoralis]|uniref:Alginate lyase 2 domain-containing protein n=1 Tax=Shewanella litoralis TaxID=2282700 RepID=A0ABQ2RK36_9GAMM|nr:polysaccharide lyase family 7 protein [Shewanella litoralis]GGQ31987.1 hypothetical protein GCM10009411_34540 [Shewanella litoralis]